MKDSEPDIDGMRWNRTLNIIKILVSIPLLIVPNIRGISSGWQTISGILGLILFFSAVIYFIEKPLYFLYILLLFILLFVFLFTDGFNSHLFMKLGEDIAVFFGIFCAAGVFASIVGYFMKR